MIKMITFILGLYSLLVTITVQIPIQAHSFNDLDYLRNIINKGINYFKLDVSMANQQSCLQHSTWKDSPCFQSSQYVQQICCLGMRGDASSRPNFKYDFNTTYDFLGLLEEVMINIPKDRTLLFAINFQYSFSFADFLTQNFLKGLVDIMNKFPDNLLIGTGSDSFILEYDRICSRYDILCTNQRRKISESSIFLQSSSFYPFDNRDVHKRYKNFNVQFQAIQKLCSNGFPSWINQNPQFPLIFWQPSDQNQIQYVLNKFMSNQCMKKHNRTLQGMAIATNIDSEMFESYMKTTVNVLDSPYKEWNIKTEKAFMQNIVNVKISAIIDQKQRVYAAGINSSSSCVNIFVLNSLAISQKMKVENIKQIKTLCDSITIQGIYFNDEKIYLVLDYGQEKYSSVYIFDQQINLIGFKNYENKRIKASFYSSQQNQLFLISTENNSKNNMYKIEGTSNLNQFTTYAELTSHLQLTSLILYSQFIILAGHYSTNQTTQSSLVVLDKKSGSLVDSEIILTHGSNPRLKLKDNVNVQILVENSMCHSAILINNNDMNKCSFYKQKQFYGISNVKGLINMIQGIIDDFINKRSQNRIIGPCQKNFRYSKIMNGEDPDIQNLQNYQMLSVQYLRVEQQDLIGAIFCGGANYSSKFKNSKGTLLIVKNKSSQINRKLRYQSK